MTASDKKIVYDFMRAASSFVCGYTPASFALKDAVFEDDVSIASPELDALPSSYDTLAAASPATVAPSIESPLSDAKGRKPLTLKSIAERIASCKSCALCNKRTQTVPGTGAENPVVLVIGEGPGYEEDISGLPFVGPAGMLLNKMLGAINLDRNKNCFIANVVKCRPPNNRTPTPQEASACLPFLDAQIHVLNPRFILAVGRTAGQALLGTVQSLMSMRHKWYTYNGRPLLITYHPSALLRDVSLKRPAWEDLKVFRARLIEECPGYDK